MTARRQTRQVMVGSLPIGGNTPISVQSMTNTDTRDVAATLAQIRRLELAGCELIRVAVPDEGAARALPNIKKEMTVSLVADIHFDHRLALMALDAGADKVRINPGNIGPSWKLKEIVSRAEQKGVPMRIGVNAGSLEKRLLKKYGHATPQAILESVAASVAKVEGFGLADLVISAKASDVPLTLDAYRLISEKFDYPLHVGISEAGTPHSGTIKSAVGIGILLGEGIGDTIRVSLATDPVEEVRVGYEILKSLGLREHGPIIIACPTCGRTELDVAGIAQQVEEQIQDLRCSLKVAVMGCAVNGPGEAREADVGIAGGKGEGLLFRKGEVVGKVKEKDLVRVLVEEVRRLGCES
ncbi:MAG: 4-hydroxy-3-methylbut-2-en-1-yl diphosphate synthase [candidate division Zixibacteria bacterium SM23_81]|nr:MAG: 4-hydroxy-3-methylbut-2-en-1-yl diphosphate synthase [candidate division Zixibacteria bacterium SM23_81]